MLYIAPQQGNLASLLVDMTTLRLFEAQDKGAASYMREMIYCGRQRMAATVCSAPTHTVRQGDEDIEVLEDSAQIEITLREGPRSRLSVPARLLELAVLAR